MAKTSFKSKLNRFFYKNRNKGIRNLMLYLAIGNVVVYLLTVLNRANPFFYQLLYFNPELILAGQVWRLFTYPLTYLCEASPVFGILSMLFYYWCGTILDQYWGSLRFNFYYLSAVLLTDLVAIGISLVLSAQLGFVGTMLNMVMGLGFASYINLSLLLAVATILPDEQVRIWFVLPVKMKWLAWLDLGITLYGLIRGLLDLLRSGPNPAALYLSLLLPLVPIVNYLLFFGKQAAGILPDFLRYHPKRKSWKRQTKARGVYVNTPRAQDGARFRCTVCGRTERTNPGLEFRYCSKCAGYRCYCQDHIHNHTHITE